LDLLQRDDLRESIKSNKLTHFLNEQQISNWRFYTNNILKKQNQTSSECVLASKQSEPQKIDSNLAESEKNTSLNTKATKNVSKANNTPNNQKKLKTDSKKLHDRSKEVPSSQNICKFENKSDLTTNDTLKQQKSKSNLKSINNLNELLNCKVLSATNSANSSTVLNSTSKQSVKFHKF
jgi:hypothetical protein